MYSGFMSNTNLRDRQASSYRCQGSTVGAVLKQLFTLFEYYADYFSYYADNFKNTNGVSGEYSFWKSVSMISGGGAEAATHHSSSTTIFPCPMDGPIAPSSCRAAYVSLRYLSQPARMAERNRAPNPSISWAMASLFCYT
jgi:hypothetical protein